MKEKATESVKENSQLTMQYISPFPLVRANPTDAGLDICSDEDVIVFARERRLIHTGLFVAIPEGFVGQIWSRSGLSLKSGIEAGAGIIDSHYRGEVGVLLYNHGTEPFIIKRGDRIAQLLTLPLSGHVPVQTEELESTERGEGGFGSTGV